MEKLTTRHKCLHINLDPTFFGSIAEIGAGQEVARHFFQAGGASGTIAKSISAYDMALSDAIYGKSSDGRYVSKARLIDMLNYEYKQVVDILSEKKEKQTRFFAFASTVVALNYRKDNDPHAWIGLKFESHDKQINQIVIHLRLLENDNLLQQQTLGIIGVNLIYTCCQQLFLPNQLIENILDGLRNDQIEVDLIETHGKAFSHIDNRLLSVQLVRIGFSQAALFNRHGQVQQPGDLFYKKNLLVLRGSFRPITYVGFDMLKSAFATCKKEGWFDKKNTLSICEMTLDNLLADGDFDNEDFLQRVDMLTGMGQHVLVTNYKQFYLLSNYFSRFKSQNIRLIIGASTFVKVMDEKYYVESDGGILTALGLLFNNKVKVYLYPTLIDNNSSEIITSKNLPLHSNSLLLFQYLIEENLVLDVVHVQHKWLSYQSRVVLQKIRNKQADWEKMVPRYIANCIKTKKLLGFDD